MVMVLRLILIMVTCIFFWVDGLGSTVCERKQESARNAILECGSDNHLSQLLSGLVGAILAVLLQAIYAGWKERKDKKSMVQALIEECKYNISIIDEIADGITCGATYKRVRDDVFVAMRKVAYRHWFDSTIYFLMARVACDESLLNNQLDILQNNALHRERLEMVNVSALAATKGVRQSLTDLVEALQK